jgi:hypothetical protein
VVMCSSHFEDDARLFIMIAIVNDRLGAGHHQGLQYKH